MQSRMGGKWLVVMRVQLVMLSDKQKSQMGQLPCNVVSILWSM